MHMFKRNVDCFSKVKKIGLSSDSGLNRLKLIGTAGAVPGNLFERRR